LQVEPFLRASLLEDLGRAGDRTTDAIIPADATATAHLVAREAGVVAGLSVAAQTFALLDPAVSVELRAAEGAVVPAGTTVAILRGPARAILSAERVALNLLGRLCGIATATRAVVDAIAGTGAVVAGTRKTTPGLRALEKYAVRCGGGANHRYGLDDAILIKDNHVAVAGSAREAVQRARLAAGHMIRISLEVDTLDQLRSVLDLPFDVVLLDNMDLEQLRQAVAMVDGRFVTEASGGVTLQTAPAIAATGVDVLSMGALTHSSPVLDVALDIEIAAGGGMQTA
jgi:nicotinate-nucleotide pyrophosphorylase (carboxylating)